jgi:hypothetical protein
LPLRLSRLAAFLALPQHINLRFDYLKSTRYEERPYSV